MGSKNTYITSFHRCTSDLTYFYHLPWLYRDYKLGCSHGIYSPVGSRRLRLTELGITLQRLITIQTDTKWHQMVMKMGCLCPHPCNILISHSFDCSSYIAKHWGVLSCIFIKICNNTIKENMLLHAGIALFLFLCLKSLIRFQKGNKKKMSIERIHSRDHNNLWRPYWGRCTALFCFILCRSSLEMTIIS